MSPTIRHKYKYFHSIVQRAMDRRQKFYFCRLPFDVIPPNVKLNLSIKLFFPPSRFKLPSGGRSLSFLSHFTPLASAAEFERSANH